jgi:purine-binding chemotaxis protein CheW
VSASTAVATAATNDAHQVLTFTLGAESFGVEILRVQEIRGWSPVTAIPESPQHVLGVMNLRGAIVPIVDLRLRLGLERVEYTPLTVIVVLSVESTAGRRNFGIVVDSVSDVTDLTAEHLKPAPDMGSGTRADYIRSLAALGDRMVMLLDVDRLLLGDAGLQF